MTTVGVKWLTTVSYRFNYVSPILRQQYKFLYNK